MKILLANPRGFCAGVDRAINIVNEALGRFGAPIYVRHEIVHNAYVVNELRDKGAIFVEDLNEEGKTALEDTYMPVHLGCLSLISEIFPSRLESTENMHKRSG